MKKISKEILFIKTKIIIKNIIIVFLISTLFNIAINYNLIFLNDESITIFNNINLLILSIVIMVPVIMLLLVVTNSYIITTALMTILAVIVYIVNRLKIGIRNEPVYPQDLTFLKNMNDLLEMITPRQKSILIAVVFLCVFVLTVLIYITIKFKFQVFSKQKSSMIIRVSLSVASIALLMYIGQYNNGSNFVRKLSTKADFYDAKWDQKLLYERNGFVLGFTYNLPGDIMDKPVNYSEKTVVDILSKYETSVEEDNLTRSHDTFEDVSVLYILSESFSDPTRVEGVTMNQSPVSYAYDASDKAYVGTTVVPLYGGGTPNSEFEVLTSLSIQNLLSNMSLPYQDFLSNYSSFPSIVSEFKKNTENKAIAVHSFTDEMYKRPAVFKTLGFDDVLYRNDLQQSEGVETSIYINDASIYNEAIDLLNTSEEDVFIHMITMQNHAPYSVEYVSPDFEVTSDVKSPAKEQIETFASGVAISDAETKKLIDAISQMDRKVIVVFYGDHLPGLYNDLRTNGDTVNIASTPYFVYSNFSTPTLDINDNQSLTSMTMLTKDLAGVKFNAFDALIYQLRQEVPAGRLNLYVDRDGAIKAKSDLSETQNQLLSDYFMIQYDIIEGNNYTQAYLGE